jgi:putative membrane protein
MSALHIIGLIVAGMAATLHVAFFVLESVLFRLPAGKKIFGVRPENDSATLRLFAVNQGVYNLALAIVVFVGIVVTIVTTPSPLGIAVIIAACSVMVVAGLALAATAPRRTIPIALAQGGLPLVAIVALLVG